MKLIKELPFIKIFFDEQSKIMEESWNDKNADITEQEIKQTIIEMANTIKIYSPTYFLADDSNRLFVYNVDIQNWVATTLAEACIRTGVQKFAIIPPMELIAQLSTEQITDEVGEIPVEIRYFNDKESALEWIKN